MVAATIANASVCLCCPGLALGFLAGCTQIGRAVGMQTVDQALTDLVEADLITPETAWRRAEKPETFEPLCSAEFLQDKGMNP